jgi:hypothetical protein
MHGTFIPPLVTIRRTDDPTHPFLIRLATGDHLLVTRDQLAEIVVLGSAELYPVFASDPEEGQ